MTAEASRTGEPRRHLSIGHVVGIVFIVASLPRLLFLSQPLEALDRLFIPDDTYYTLLIARSLGAGLGPVASDGVLTNGFQPLLAFVLAPLSRLGLSADQLVWATLYLGGAVGSVCASLVVWLVHVATDRRSVVPPMLAGLIWALSPVSITVELGGLESSLALAFVMCTTALWLGLREREEWWAWALIGTSVGLMLLARVDTCFVAVALGLHELFRGNRRGLLICVGLALMIVSPWWGYSILTFGTPVPESGAAVRHLAADHQAVYLKPLGQVGWAAGYALPGVFGNAVAFRGWLFQSPVAASVSFGVVVAGLLSAWWKRPSFHPIWFSALALLALYTFWVPAIWFFQRYFLPVYAAGLIAVASLLPERARSLVLGLLLATASFGIAAMEPAFGLHGTKGYRGPAIEVHRALGPGSRIGAMQTGAIAYFAPPQTRVFNLDGVVDSRSAAAIRKRALADFVREQQLDYVVDWPFNLGAIGRFSVNSEPLRLYPIAATTPQGPDQFVITRNSR